MRSLDSVKPSLEPSSRGIGSRLPICQETVRQVPPALRPGLPSCSRRGDAALTRGEMAAVFGRSRRTIYRWETDLGISAERKNARVLRYGLDCVVGLVASGLTLDTEEAERLGLNPKAIIAMASAIAARPNSHQEASTVQNAILVAESDDDRRLIAAWGDPTLGPVMRRILRGLTEQPPETDNFMNLTRPQEHLNGN